MENRRIKHISFYSTLIETMGYDPQCAILEIKLLSDGKIRQYKNVPEYVWYHLREDYHPDTYYRRHICGRYTEVIISDDKEES
ncbi:MAG: KTSC domain-containing protein [Lachnospiraceae bacterium]|jgi:hypothetical protein|nr:KTSC domain-containing protein [Lachnospiraceae bacterium]